MLGVIAVGRPTCDPKAVGSTFGLDAIKVPCQKLDR